MRKRLVLATLLSLIVSATTTGHTTAPILPLTQEQFTPVQMYPFKSEIPLIKEHITELPVPTSKPEIAVVESEPKEVLKSTPRAIIQASGRSISGLASWYCKAGVSPCHNAYGPGTFAAAAGPQLRVALGGGYDSNAPQPWRGKTVNVCGSKGCVNVKLVDWCQCYWKQGNEKLLDLYNIVFVTIGADKGKVTVSW